MAIQTVFENAAVRLQVSASFKVSQRIENWIDGGISNTLVAAYNPEFPATAVKVGDTTYEEVATSGALAAGKWWLDTANEEIVIYPAQGQDRVTLEEFTSSPTQSQLVEGSLGEPIPGDANAYDEYNFPMALSGLYTIDDLTDHEANWWIYMALQHFAYYVVENSITVYGYWEPYLVYTDITGTKSFYSAYTDEFTPGPYFDYTNWTTLDDDYSALRDSSSGSNGWTVVIQYVTGVSGGSPAVNMTAKKEPYLDGSDLNFDSWTLVGTTGDDPVNDVTRVEYAIGMAKHSDVMNDIYQHPRIISAPQIEKRIEALFGKPIQRGSGNLVLNNADGYFEPIRRYNWAGNVLEITVRAGYPNKDFSDSQFIGRYLMADVDWGRDRVSVRVEEPTKFFDAGFPLRFFDDLNTVNRNDETEGRHVPYIYGRVFGVKAFPVLKGKKEFQVADHPIHSISNPVRIVNGQPVPVLISAKDYEAGRFSISEWNEGEEVLCDVNGFVDENNNLLNNPADITCQILDKMAFATVNTASITEARGYYDVSDSFPFRTVDKEVGLYIDEPGKVGDVLQKINQACFSYFRFNNSDEIEFKSWYPQRRTDITVEILDHELIEFREITSEREIITELHSVYQIHEGSDDQHIVKITSDGKKRYNLGGERVKSLKSHSSSRDRATSFGQKAMTIQGMEARTYRLSMVFRPITWLPGDQVRLNVTRWGFDEIVEILSVSADLINGRCNITFSNRRNWERSSGWYSEPSAPSYSGASSDATNQSQWEEWGYWSDDDGFLDATKASTHKTSRYL